MSKYFSRLALGVFVPVTVFTLGFLAHTTTAKAAAVKNYTISFYATDGSGTMPAQVVAKGSKVKLLSNTFTKSGYYFNGWSKTVGGKLAYADGAYYPKISADVTLYALWEPAYTLTFSSNGGSGVALGTLSLSPRDKIKLPVNTFTKEGYTFDGWSRASGDKNKVSYRDGGNYTVNKAVRHDFLYAVWKRAPMITITFDVNGGVGYSVPIEPLIKQKGSNVTLPDYRLGSGFYKEGHTFKGWSLSRNGEVFYPNGGSGVFDKNTTLYAVWMPGKTITFLPGDGGVGSMPPIMFEAGDSIQLPLNTFSNINPDKVFTGWYDQIMGIVRHGNGAIIKFDDDDISKELVADWKTLVTYDPGNGGYGQMAPSYCGERLRKNSFERPESILIGWATALGGEVKCTETGGSVGEHVWDHTCPASRFEPCESTVHLYAVWDTKRTLIFHPNGAGGSIYTQTFGDSELTYGDRGAKIKPVAFSPYPGRIFYGWSKTTDGDMVCSDDPAELQYAKHCFEGESKLTVDLYALWNEKTTISFDSQGGGGEMSPQEVEKSRPFGVYPGGYSGSLNRNTFVKPGYSFKGWAVYADKTKIVVSDGGPVASIINADDFNAELTLYAVWTPGQNQGYQVSGAANVAINGIYQYDGIGDAGKPFYRKYDNGTPAYIISWNPGMKKWGILTVSNSTWIYHSTEASPLPPVSPWYSGAYHNASSTPSSVTVTPSSGTTSAAVSDNHNYATVSTSWWGSFFRALQFWK